LKPVFQFEEKFRDAILRCSRCGFCQTACPVYGATLRPALNARGKMLVLLEVIRGEIDLNDELIETLFQCTGCAGCVEACPSGVKVPEILRQARRDLVGRGSCHPALKAIFDGLKKQTNIYGDREPKDFGKERNRKAGFVYFVGCVGSYREKEATLAILKLLDRLQIDYTLVDEVCCSGVLEDIGYRIDQRMAGKNIDLILAAGAHTVITGCPYCYRTFKEKPSYVRLTQNGVALIHLSQFLTDVEFGVKTDQTITYHDPCDLGRHTGSYEATRRILRKIAPNFVEMPHHHAGALCCGAGGGLRGAYAKNSIAIARRRLREVEEVGAEVLLTDCNSCVHNFSNAKLSRQHFRICNTAQFLNELMEKG
jgi:Fe-S oxidoreductase